MANIIKLKGNVTNENPPSSLEEREIAINEVSGKLYARRVVNSEERIVCIGGNDGVVIYSDAGPSDNTETYLLLSADEAIEIRKIVFRLDEGALTGNKLRKRIFDQPATEGSGYMTIATFNANTSLQTVEIFNEDETEANPSNRYINVGEGLLIETGIGSDPVNFTLQINFRVLGVEVSP